MEIRCLIYLLHKAVINHAAIILGNIESEVRRDNPELISECRKFIDDYCAYLADVFIFTNTTDAYKEEKDRSNKLALNGQALINQLQVPFITLQPEDARGDLRQEFNEHIFAIWQYTFNQFEQVYPQYTPPFLGAAMNGGSSITMGSKVGSNIRR